MKKLPNSKLEWKHVEFKDTGRYSRYRTYASVKLTQFLNGLPVARAKEAKVTLLAQNVYYGLEFVVFYRGRKGGRK